MDKRRRKVFVNILLYGVLGIYILLLLLILFRQHHAVRSVNLVPLRGITAFLTGKDLVTGSMENAWFIRGFALSNILGNIVIFVPLGVYVTLFHKDKAVWKNTLWVVLASVAVEVGQFAFKMGIGDIDDVILNGLGGLLGVLLCRGIYRVCKNEDFMVRCTVAVMAPLVGVLSFGILLFMNYT